MPFVDRRPSELLEDYVELRAEMRRRRLLKGQRSLVEMLSEIYYCMAFDLRILNEKGYDTVQPRKDGLPVRVQIKGVSRGTNKTGRLEAYASEGPAAYKNDDQLRPPFDLLAVIIFDDNLLVERGLLVHHDELLRANLFSREVNDGGWSVAWPRIQTSPGVCFEDITRVLDKAVAALDELDRVPDELWQSRSRQRQSPRPCRAQSTRADSVTAGQPVAARAESPSSTLDFGDSRRLLRGVPVEIHPRGISTDDFQNAISQHQDDAGVAVIHVRIEMTDGTTDALTWRMTKRNVPFWDNAASHHVKTYVKRGRPVRRIDYALQPEDFPPDVRSEEF